MSDGSQDGGGPEETRRASRRIPLFVEVSVRDRGGSYFHRARNISAGGMFVDSPVPLPEGTRVRLSFRLPGGGPIELTGEVRWTTRIAGQPVPHPGMGVSFTDVTPEQREAIVRYVAETGFYQGD
ncbi:TIGR02266 family protein [Myxococcota bacterium]|nr:TIGR02266 family protein [Myxococcota bacterium]